MDLAALALVKRRLPAHGGSSAVLLLTAAWSMLSLAAEPPTGTLTRFNNIGLFNSTTGLLQSCVALQDTQGNPTLDGNGNAEIYAVTLGLQPGPGLIFKLLSYTPFDSSAGKDCSGIFRNGSYNDQALLDYPGSNLDGAVLNVQLDFIPLTNLEFRLRTDVPGFGVVRNLTGNSTALGSSLGDFQFSSVRDFTNALPPSIKLTLPTCADPQGDANTVVLEKDGVAFATGTPGTVYTLNTAALAAGNYTIKAYCSDEASIRALATAADVNLDTSKIALSAYAPGTVQLKVPVSSTSSSSSSSSSSTNGELSFNFDAATSSSDQQLIQQAANFARTFLQTTFGRTLQKNATITTSTTAAGCKSGGSAAFTGSQNMVICIQNDGWKLLPGPINKQKVIIHEVFHLLQFEMHWIGIPNAGPQWLIEGSAEYFGWLGIASQDLLSFDTARGCMLKQVADFVQRQPPGLPNLDALETAQQFQIQGPVYPLGMLAVDELLASTGVSALMTFGNALGSGSSVDNSFQTAFATDRTTFYNQFPAYKASLTVPVNYLCGM